MLKFISWNVNGLRACYDKGFVDVFHRLEADFFCLQETKMQEGQLDAKFEGYHSYWNYAEKKGYSGTAIFSKVKPLSVTYGLGIEEHDHEGRVITLELESFYLITVYTPNSQEELRRLDYRMKWEDDFRAYLKKLEEKKPVIVCGDLNVAHKEIDLKNPKTNRKNAGFTDEERAKFTTLLESGFTDTFRYFYPEQEGIYSWWSYRFEAREKNSGWRTNFGLFYYENEINKTYIGSVKITDSVNYNLDNFPTTFTLLEDNFCSLGQEEDYYLNLKKIFGRNFESILYSLRDAAFFPEIQEKFENEDSFKQSLIRYDSSEQLFRN
jgi:exodeoxyribonuclease-3